MRTGPVAVVLLATAALLFASAPANAQPKAATVADHWDDFIHYVQIARPDLALKYAELCLQADGAALLDAVEASRAKDEYELLLERAGRIETLKQAAGDLAKKIQDAKFKRARDPERIKVDIQKLSQGERARRNALERLKEANQFAVKYMLATLLNSEEQRLHPYVLAGLVSIGRDAVYPLAEALHDLEPVPMAQVAEVLGEIGYPRSLPYLKRVMEDDKVDAAAKAIVAKAFNQIAKSQGITENDSAAFLFHTLGGDFYKVATDPRKVLPGTDPLDGTGVVWVYNRTAGLVDVHVPGQIFGDVLAHRAARNALQLKPDMDQALSLWLMANLRRENRLAAGQDLSYPPTWQPPTFYLRASHPMRAHDVLERALTDRDADLARDAIQGLSDIAGTKEIMNETGLIQPMLRALSYPDRRVRYESAFALTNTRPTASFPGSFRIVPVLAEAVRQTEIRYALILVRKTETFGEVNAKLLELGYNGFGGVTLEQSLDELNLKPGVDLIVTDYDLEDVARLYQQTTEDYKLAAVPIVAIGNKNHATLVGVKFETNTRIFGGEANAENKYEGLKAAVDAARKAYVGKEIEADEAAKYASRSLTLLRDIATSRQQVFNVTNAQAALAETIAKDSRGEIVKQAGGVLALFDNEAAQRPLATAALDEGKAEDVRVSLLNSLAESATHYGARLNEVQLNGVHALVETGKGDLALAAARAYGALAQPTSKIVDLIRK